MTNLSASRLLAGVSVAILALDLVPAASAQTQEAKPAATPTEAPSQTDGPATDVAPAAADDAVTDADIVVTGSRVVTNGFQAPTPVTVLGTEELRNTAPSLTEALRLIPQLQGSSSPASVSPSPQGGPSTTDTANLRNLGATRTLVLLDGRRPPISGVSGTVDTSQFPQQLVKRVDIVTGGASAAYGSDAVSGVVNYVLDTSFTGLLAEARSGISEYGDAASYGFQVSAGMAFAGERGHLIVNGNALGQNGLNGPERDFARRFWAAIPNPNAAQSGQPALLLRDNVNLAAATFGGIVITPGALRDTAFDASGNPIPYRRGTLSTGTVEVGGDGARYPIQMSANFDNRSVFGHVDFEVTDAVKIFAEGSYGHSRATYANLLPFNLGASGAYTIQRDNAYLPTSVRATMIASGLNTIQVGKIDLNYGRTQVRNKVDTVNAIVGADVTLPGGFSANVYYEHGESTLRYSVSNNRIQANSRLAVDAVRDPASGQIVCRSTLGAPTNGCVPVNPFGIIPLTDAQRGYLTGTSTARSIAKQDVVSATVRGNLFSTWAGPVAMAAGAEYRRNSGDIRTDAISQRLGFTTSNIQPARGKYEVKEAFAEILVPLLRDVPLFNALDLNGAIRRTDYSTSGGVTTWKVGVTDEVIDGLLLRGTLSQDIRAPNIGDLFGPVTRVVATVRDPVNGNRFYNNIFSFSGSNPDLVPERARTVTAGISYRPPYLRGFGVSVDYYRLKIDGAIATLPFQTIVDQCSVGVTQLCSLITRNAANEIVQLNATAQNIQTARVSGLDFETSYATRIGVGALNIRAIATYLDDYRFVSPGAADIQQAGVGNLPRWRGNLQVTYAHKGTTLSVQERYIGTANRALPPLTIDNNKVPATFYTNFTLRQAIGEGDKTPELFFTVNNLFNQKPRVSLTNSLNLGIANQYDTSLYDVLGRYFTVGGRIRF